MIEFPRSAKNTTYEGLRYSDPCSVISDKFEKESDIDVLVEFEPGQVVGLLRMAGMEHELSDLFGRPVDLRTPSDLSRYFRDEVLASAEVQYAQG